jgi:hypothetical protein
MTDWTCRLKVKAISRVFLFTVAACSTAAIVRADWPQFRGPNRDDISKETGLLKDWPKGGPPLAWKATGLGTGFSTVSVANGHIYTMGEQGGVRKVFALDMNGKNLWSTPIETRGDREPHGLGNYPGTRSAPTVDGQYIYALAPVGTLACLNVAEGKVLWQKSMVKDLGGEPPEWGYAESPLIEGELVICTPGGSQGTLAALNKKTGDVIWRSQGWTDPAHYSSVVAANIGGQRHLIQLTPASVGAVSPEGGKLLWKVNRKGIGSDLFKIEGTGGNYKVLPVYTQNINVMQNKHGGVVLIDGKLYGHSENKGWTCQDFMTGDLVWREKQKLGMGSITYADGRLYLRQENSPGTVAIIEANPAGWKEHGRFDPPDHSDSNIWPHPVVDGGKLYLRDQDVLLCYDVKAK